MAIIVKNYETWDNIKAKYPDSFVLLENPEFEHKYSPILKRGIFIYKNKSKRRVFEKAESMKLNHITIQYTGGKRMDNLNENVLIL